MATPASTVVSDFFGQIDTAFVSFFFDAATRLAGAARPAFNSLVTLYVLLWGFSMWRGLIQVPLSDGVMRVIKIVLIGTFVRNAGVYGNHIAQRIYRMPEQFAAVVAPVAAVPARNAIDRSIDAGLDVVEKFQSAAAMASGFVEPLVLHLDALVAFFCVGLLAFYAAALMLLAKIGLSIALALGPIFIAALLFEPTRQLFSAWCNQVLNFLMTFIVASTIVSLGMAFFSVAANSVVASIGSNPPAFTQLLKIILVGGAVFITLLQTTAIASGLAGDIQLGTMGAVAWATSRGKSVLGAPFSAYDRARAWNDRRIARDYYRERLGKLPTASTRSLAWMRQTLRGSNQKELSRR